MQGYLRYYLANIFQGAICTVQLRLNSRGTHLVFVLGRTENNPNKQFFLGRIFCFSTRYSNGIMAK